MGFPYIHDKRLPAGDQGAGRSGVDVFKESLLLNLLLGQPPPLRGQGHKLTQNCNFLLQLLARLPYLRASIEALSIQFLDSSPHPPCYNQRIAGQEQGQGAEKQFHPGSPTLRSRE